MKEDRRAVRGLGKFLTVKFNCNHVSKNIYFQKCKWNTWNNWKHYSCIFILSLPITCIIWIIKNVFKWYLNLHPPPKPAFLWLPFDTAKLWKELILLVFCTCANAVLSWMLSSKSLITIGPSNPLLSRSSITAMLPTAMVTQYLTQVIIPHLKYFLHLLTFWLFLTVLLY